MIKRFAFAAVLLFALTPVCATAQSGNAGQAGRRSPPPGIMSPEMHQRTNPTKLTRALDNRNLDEAFTQSEIHSAATTIAKCVAQRGGDKAADYLGGGLAGDAEYARLGKALKGKLRTCADTDVTATAAAISGALAEQLLALKAPTFTDRAIGVNDLAAREFYGELNGQVTFDTIAGCLAVYSPGLTYKLIQSEVDSAAETAALGAVFAQTPECGMPTPPTSVIPVATQRQTLATALYEWTTRQS